MASTFGVIDAVSSLFGSKSEGYYRILTASGRIKYLAFHPSKHALPDIRGERLNIDTLPEGTWTIGNLVLKDGANKYTLGSISETSLPSVQHVWCARSIDYLQLGEPPYDQNALQCAGNGPHVTVRCGHFGMDQVIAHLEWDPSSIYPIDHYTDIFFLIDGRGIGPKFLAHITENNSRVIGYVVESVRGCYATHADLEPCRAVLSRLHALGLVHGMLHSQSFIIAEDGRAMLHDFGTCFKSDDPNSFVDEMAGLEEALNQEAFPSQTLEPRAF